MAREIVRRDTHAGSWYEDAAEVLDSQLTNWLQSAGPSVHGPARALIVPHAGYAYSGPCAAYAYKEVDTTRIKRVFILGPSHHVSLSGCALSKADVYQTPLYNLKIDKQLNKELLESRMFEEMSMRTDEDEHSIEMHLPYVAKIMQGKEFKIVPILVGSSSSDREVAYGKLLSKYLINEENLFVISSDFCHWGSRFGYQHYDRNWGAIYESIEKLDRMGMDLIETCKASVFKNYLNEYGNTICGRNPILLLLNAIEHSLNSNLDFKLKFINYAQSSKCMNQKDSSVSYASASLVINQK